MDNNNNVAKYIVIITIVGTSLSRDVQNQSGSSSRNTWILKTQM